MADDAVAPSAEGGYGAVEHAARRVLKRLT